MGSKSPTAICLGVIDHVTVLSAMVPSDQWQYSGYLSEKIAVYSPTSLAEPLMTVYPAVSAYALIRLPSNSYSEDDGNTTSYVTKYTWMTVSWSMVNVTVPSTVGVMTLSTVTMDNNHPSAAAMLIVTSLPTSTVCTPGNGSMDPSPSWMMVKSALGDSWTLATATAAPTEER